MSRRLVKIRLGSFPVKTVQVLSVCLDTQSYAFLLQKVLSHHIEYFSIPHLVVDADRGLGCTIPHPFLPPQLDGEDPPAQGADRSSLCQVALSTVSWHHSKC